MGYTKDKVSGLIRHPDWSIDRVYLWAIITAQTSTILYVFITSGTVGYKMKMDVFQFCPIKQCAIELDNLTIDSTKSTDLDFTRMEFTKDLLILPKEISFNLKNQFTLHVCPDVNGLPGD